jgi:hypothetical protein
MFPRPQFDIETWGQVNLPNQPSSLYSTVCASLFEIIPGIVFSVLNTANKPLLPLFSDCASQLYYL